MLGLFIALFLIGAATTTGGLAAARGAAIAAFAGASVVAATWAKAEAPSGTCDTHIHIYDHRYPKAATGKILAPDASVAPMPMM